MTPTEDVILTAVAYAFFGSADEALSLLIEEGLIDSDLHTESEEWQEKARIWGDESLDIPDWHTLD